MDLTHRELEILRHRSNAKTFREIGMIYHVDPERIRQITIKALRKLLHIVFD